MRPLFPLYLLQTRLIDDEYLPLLISLFAILEGAIYMLFANGYWVG